MSRGAVWGTGPETWKAGDSPPCKPGKGRQRIPSDLKKGAAGLRGDDSDLQGRCGPAGSDGRGEGGGLPESEVSQSGEGLRPGAQAAPLLFLALVTGSQLPTLSPGLGRVPSGAGKREEVGMPWLRTCPD